MDPLLLQPPANATTAMAAAASSFMLSVSSPNKVRQYVHEWRFEPNVTPFSQWYWPVMASILYFVIVYSIQFMMTTRKPLDIPYFLFCHNMTLCVASLALAIWLTYTLASFLYGGMSPYAVLCSVQSYDDGHIQLIYYVNSLFKVWEFMDTFLLALRKKPIAFLHAYHHAATLILTWNQLVEHSAPQWVPIIINLWVHVIMYYYYAMSALKIRIWWKKYLTSFQICQFVLDVAIIGYAYFVFIQSGYDMNVCYGTSRGAIVGLTILFSYLLLFVRFYFETYSSKPSSSSSKKQQ